MRELLKFRNLEERDIATVAERCRVLLGYSVTIGLRSSKEGPRDLSDVMLKNTRRCILRMSDSSVYRRD
jgi:hypothetical protein